MRTTTFATRIGLLVLAAVLVAPVAVASAAGSGPKVVVIVGPVGSQTSSYRADADTVAAAALQYTSNVVKIYTPTATWAAAKAALQGASIVVYMGHGNGFPSPYSTALRPTSQDGLGLNPSAGTDNTTTQYYGESYLANEIRLAPNAIVLLHHLCYASGNSEPGRAEPTISVAQQRVDNYGAGWLRTGARAVVTDAHYGGAYYVNALFTTNQSIDSIWRAAPGARGNYTSFPSARTPGALAQMDPVTPTSGFYRAFVGDPALTSSAVTGGTFAAPAGGFGTPTNADPASFAVPGAATVSIDAAGLYADPSLTPDPATGGPTALLTAGTPIRLQARAGNAPDGTAVFQIATLDGTRTGFMTAAGLAPRDSVGPQILSIDDGGGSFSPNGDGRADAFQLSGTLSEEAAWNVAFTTAAGSIVAQASGYGTTFGAAWDGTVNGAIAADGAYRYTVRASDQWGNAPAARSGSIRIDSSGPALAPASASALAPTTFSPNGDGLSDTVAVDLVASEAGFVDVGVVSAFGQQVRTFAVPSPAGRVRVGWDGSSDGGGIVPDGTYLLTMTPRDAGGNIGAGQSRPVSVYTAVSAVRSSQRAIHPQDANGSAPAATTLSFALAAPATVTWTVSNAAGRSIFTQYLSTPLPPGAYAFEWNGRDQAGTVAPPGTYFSNVLATDGTLSLRTRSPFAVGAFAVTSSDTTPARGQTITITAVSAEPLRAAPRLAILQPGVAARVVTMTRSGAGYRVTIALRRTTRIGSLVLKVTGSDAAAVASTSVVSFPLH